MAIGNTPTRNTGAWGTPHRPSETLPRVKPTHGAPAAPSPLSTAVNFSSGILPWLVAVKKKGQKSGLRDHRKHPHAQHRRMGHPHHPCLSGAVNFGRGILPWLVAVKKKRTKVRAPVPTIKTLETTRRKAPRVKPTHGAPVPPLPPSGVVNFSIGRNTPTRSTGAWGTQPGHPVSHENSGNDKAKAPRATPTHGAPADKNTEGFITTVGMTEEKPHAQHRRMGHPQGKAQAGIPVPLGQPLGRYQARVRGPALVGAGSATRGGVRRCEAARRLCLRP